MRGTLSFFWHLPRNICVVILRVYRAVISPLYGDVCRYYPSCSAYALEAIQQRGVVIGVGFGIRRLARCHPWAAGGVDDVPVTHRRPTTPFGFVPPSSAQVHPSWSGSDHAPHTVSHHSLAAFDLGKV
ncbi:MAG: rane protein insertion efficiency factor YidD [Actinomycetota bacterium]